MTDPDGDVPWRTTALSLSSASLLLLSLRARHHGRRGGCGRGWECGRTLWRERMRLEQKSKLATEYARERKEKNIKNCEKEEHICALSRPHRDSYLPCYPATNLLILVSFPDHWSQQSVVWEWDNPHFEVSHTARNPGSMGGKVCGGDYLTCSSFRSTSCRTLALCVNDLRRSESTLNNVHGGMMYAGMQDMIGTSLSGCVHYNHYLIWAVCP